MAFLATKKEADRSSLGVANANHPAATTAANFGQIGLAVTAWPTWHSWAL